MYGEFFKSGDVVFVMALVEPIKKGGRYPKKEQEERRLQVYHLHFEKKKSASKIARQLNVNRNTINEDIKLLYRQSPNKLKIIDIYEGITEEILRKKFQRGRLFEYLEKAEKPEDRFKIEKLIFDIGNKLEQTYLKAVFSNEKLPPSIKVNDDIPEEQIIGIVKWILSSKQYSKFGYMFSENSIKFLIIFAILCDGDFAERVFQKMVNYGLRFCIAGSGFSADYKESIDEEYNLEKFAIMRKYFSNEEWEEIKIMRTVDDEGKYTRD